MPIIIRDCSGSGLQSLRLESGDHRLGGGKARPAPPKRHLVRARIIRAQIKLLLDLCADMLAEVAHRDFRWPSAPLEIQVSDGFRWPFVQYEDMGKNKGKRNVATYNAVLHGLQSHWLHLLHTKQSKKRQKIVFVAHEVMDGSDYPVFRSDVKGLGSGRNWILRDGKAELTDGPEWVEEMMEMLTDGMRYDTRQRNATKDGEFRIRYTPRDVEDRKKKGKTDKKGRQLTDLMRETIDLRPDHSKVLQYLLENGRKSELLPVLAEIQAEEIRLFEEIHHGRRILSNGEHTDSGQYHFDHWHSGIEEIEVHDHGAIVVDGPEGEEVLKSGENKKVRKRHLFRIYGVGDGMASFDRHRSALREAGHDAKSIMGHTIKKLARNTKSAKKQNGEFPRDLRLWRAIDKFVDQKLRELDPGLCDKARTEYVEWLEAGYDLQKLGIKEETLEQSKHKRRKKELESLQAAVRVVMELILAIPGVVFLLKSSETVWKKIDDLLTMVAPKEDPEVQPKKRRRSQPSVKKSTEPQIE